MKGHYINISLDRIVEIGYEPTGTPALINVGFPLHAGTANGIAKKAIDEINPGLDYVGCAIFTFSSDGKEARKIIGDEIPGSKRLHFATIIPLRETLSKD